MTNDIPSFDCKAEPPTLEYLTDTGNKLLALGHEVGTKVLIAGISSVVFLVASVVNNLMIENSFIHGAIPAIGACISMIALAILVEIESSYSKPGYEMLLELPEQYCDDVIKMRNRHPEIREYVSKVAQQGRKLTVSEYNSLKGWANELEILREKEDNQQKCKELYLG